MIYESISGSGDFSMEPTKILSVPEDVHDLGLFNVLVKEVSNEIKEDNPGMNVLYALGSYNYNHFSHCILTTE